MKFINKKEENGVTTMSFIGAFIFPYIEILDFLNSSYSFFDKTEDNVKGTNKFTFDMDGTRYPIPKGELYKQPKRYGAGITGIKNKMFKGVPLTVCIITDTRRIEVSFDTEASKKVININGDILTEAEVEDTILDIVSKLEIYGTIMTEQSRTMDEIRKQLTAYVRDPEHNNTFHVGSTQWNIDEILQPPEKEDKTENEKEKG